MNRKTSILCSAIFLLIIGISSCTSYFRTVTTIYADGSCKREIYAVGDSTFLAGNMSKSPYFFRLDSSWQKTLLKQKQAAQLGKEYNVKVSKQYSSVNSIQASVQSDENLRSIAAPVESLQEQFRWFYTYHYYTARYKEISSVFPVPVDTYLSKKEQKIWFQGDLSSCKGMNGMELKEHLSAIEDGVKIWYNHNMYELSFECIQVLDGQKSSSPYLSQLDQIKDSLFRINERTKLEDFDIKGVCQILDTFFHTHYYSQLISGFSEKEINQIHPQYQKRLDALTNLMVICIDYELALPGKCIETNASSFKQDTLVWRVNFPRFFADDYLLTAEYRTINYWTFFVTGLLILFSLSVKPLYNRWRKGKRNKIM